MQSQRAAGQRRRRRQVPGAGHAVQKQAQPAAQQHRYDSQGLIAPSHDPPDNRVTLLRVVLFRGSWEVPVAIGPWDPHAAAIGRLRASDADRDRVVDAFKAAYAQGLLSTDELAARTSRALAARTYADLTAASAALAERPAPPSIHPPARTRVSKKAV